MKNTEPAFPINGGAQEHQYNGMTLRDYFAKAMSVIQSMSAYNMLPKETFVHYVGRTSYEMADAMLEARK